MDGMAGFPTISHHCRIVCIELQREMNELRKQNEELKETVKELREQQETMEETMKVMQKQEEEMKETIDQWWEWWSVDGSTAAAASW